MRIVGDCETDGTVRVEGTVEGNIRAEKAVVVGREGKVKGDIATQDAVISGMVQGTIRAGSRLEVQATSRIEGEVVADRMQLEEGAVLNGTVQMGKAEPMKKATALPATADPTSPGKDEGASGS
jgi:cytoskeletal protein CcmA (bactofilin family)